MQKKVQMEKKKPSIKMGETIFRIMENISPYLLLGPH
jgi:hypothetical protein